MKIFSTENSFLIDLNDFLLKKHQLFNIHLEQNSRNLYINIENNVVFEKPIYLINSDHVNLNISVNSGENNSFTLIDHKNNQNNITYINCQDNSKIDYYLIQNNDNSKIFIQQASNSKLLAKLLATALNSNALLLEINFVGQNAIVYLSILQNTKLATSNKIDLLINHLTTLCSSYTAVRSVAADTSTNKFTGRIVVHKSAQKTYADLQSKGLMLSKDATISNKPELDIYTNDIVCTHGSTVGHLDQKILFYMQTRGIDFEKAKQILLQTLSFSLILF